MLKTNQTSTIEWLFSSELIPYPKAVQIMETRVEKIYRQEANELIWFLEHPPLYTSGTSAKNEDLLNPLLLPVFQSNRGGQYTYHGPGQRIIYPLLNLKNFAHDVRSFVRSLENWIIKALHMLNVDAFRCEGRIGIWVKDQSRQEKKIAAIGIRLKKWISYHGISLNINPNLEHFNGIIPCGLKNYGVTSLHELGIQISMGEVDEVLKKSFCF